ncbi:MAG: diacylglycerol kinase family lipid kinase [bacterium]|nr:diacylglycerol kinase family lipid kinase [bacterium]
MRILVIVNPVSGRRNLAAKLAAVVDHLCAAGCDVAVRLTRGAGDGTRMAADSADDLRAILVVGGDGTVREVIEGLMDTGRRTPVAIMSTGTENLAARELDMPTDPPGLARLLRTGQPLAHDVGVVNGRHFLTVTGAGFDAEIVHRLSAVRGSHITHWSYFWPAWRTLWGHHFPRLRIDADGQDVFDGPGFAIVGVTSRYSVGLRVCQQAKIGDGLLDPCIYPCNSRARVLRHAFDTFCGRHVRAGRVIYRKCRRVRIDAAPTVPLEVDGDPGGHLPAECEVLPGAAVFLENATTATAEPSNPG